MERIIYGRNTVAELLKANCGKIIKICILKSLKEKKYFTFIAKVAKNKSIPVLEESPDFFKKNFSQLAHQGIIANVHEFVYADLENVLKKIKEKKKIPFLLLLDKIQDPHNLGSLIRTAEIFNIDAVIIPERRAAQITATVAKVSQGAVESLPVIMAGNLVNTIKGLKKEGFWIIGADTDADKPFFDVDFIIPLVLVLGSEGQGLTRLIKENCDLIVNIPQGGKIPSLNVGVAAGIIMCEVFRQRNFQKINNF